MAAAVERLACAIDRAQRALSAVLELPAGGTAEAVIAEVASTRVTERGATRADDRISEAGMEDRKKEGYF